MSVKQVRELTPYANRSALWPSPLSELHESIRVVLENRIERGRKAHSQPFKGITLNSNVAPGLFPIKPTNASTKPISDAARAFLGSLTPEERKAVSFPIDSNEWRAWSNAHPFLFRHGICLHHLSDDKRAKAMELMRASLSERGYDALRNAMKLREHLFELTGRHEEHGEYYYFISLFGEPGDVEPWGWQIDGHHLVVNCFVLGDQIVVSPHFIGGEPTLAKSGKYAGTRVLVEEEAAGHRLMSALSAQQQAKARIAPKLPTELVTILHWDNHVMPYQGISYRELTSAQKDLMHALILTHVGHIRPEHAEVRLAEVMAHIEDTHFAWIGLCDDESPFYCRVHNPVFLVEFLHQAGVAFVEPEPTRNHAHSLVRTPNGNDYGRELLRQHRLRSSSA